MGIDILNQLKEIGFLPLAEFEDANEAVPLAKSLQNGGMPVIEVTYRTSCASECIKKISSEVPGMLIGAGTIHTVQQVKEAINAGAKFIVTPGYNEETVAYCIANNILIIPGIADATGAEKAMNAGISTVKFFPAEASGGCKAIKALMGPFKEMMFLPTGGIDQENMLDYLSLPNVLAIGGSFLCPKKLVNQKDWKAITKNCKEILFKEFGFSVGHVGINASSEKEAQTIAHTLSDMFGQTYMEFPGACFAGWVAEVVKPSANGQRGEKGHIAINTRDIDRAAAYYRRNGIAFDEKSAGHNSEGKLSVIFFKDEIGGFAIHLRRE